MSFKQIIDIIRRRKIYLIISIFCFLLGFVLAFCISNDSCKILLCESTVSLYSAILLGEALIVSILARKAFILFLIFIFLCLLGMKIYCFPAHFLIFVYLGFWFGITIFYLVKAFAFIGFIISICVIFPTSILFFSASLILSIMLFNHLLMNHNKIDFSALLQYFLIAISIAITVCAIECLLLFIFITPLNLLI